MKCKSIILNLFILMGVLNAEPPKQDAVKQELTSVMRAPYVGGKAVILKHTHPKIIEVSGGQENFEKAIDYLQKTLSDGGVTFDSVKIGKPYSYVATKANEFFLVDVTLVLKKGGQKQVNKLTQVAVRSVGSEDWCYIDSSGLSDEVLRKLFPQLPRSFPLKKAEEQDGGGQPATRPESE
ncbi:hypothetical protein N9821_00230 [Akkermansiaceae bacterium]|nr:hypothetical protein [Akkermansiaceae bacterium]MDB4259555.1 hypothetical protein [Akkermansiaceae bacterium]MDB4462090.1 hypothetical protein [bacterium]